MKTNLSWIHYLLCCHCYIFHIPILVKAFNYSSIIKSWDKKVDIADCLPTFFGNYLLIFVVHIVNWSYQNLSSLMLESMKDTNRSHIKIFNHLFIPYESILQILEKEISFPQSIRNSIIDIVIIDNSCCIFSILTLFWCISNNHIPILLNLP